MDAEQLIRSLGGTGNLRGFHYAVYMVGLIERDPVNATLVTKFLYPETARQFGVTTMAVERNLRTLIHNCWNRGDRELMCQVAGARLTGQPTNGEFLDILAAFLRRQKEF